MMSDCEKQLKNETKKSLQNSETSQTSSSEYNISDFILKSSEAQVNLNKTSRSCFSSRLTLIQNATSSSSSEEKALPKIEGWRRAALKDKSAIENLQTLTGDVTNLLYRRKKIEDLIEKSYFPIVQFDSKGDLISFTAYDSYPDIPSTPFLWIEWLNVNYRIEGICARNALFIHYMVWQPKHENKFLLLLLKTTFSEFVHLKYIIIVKPPKTDVPALYKNYFTPVQPFGLEETELSSIQLLLLCLRSTIIHPLPIRTVFEQELDIVTSVLNTRIKTGKSMLDFLNILYQKDQKTLICELDGNVAGIMILNLKINLEFLSEGFELEPFNGLRKKNEDEENLQSETSSAPEQSSHKMRMHSNLLLSSEFLFSQMNWEMTLRKIRPTDSIFTDITPESSLTQDSSFSQFSFIRLSSIFDVSKKYSSHETSYNQSDHSYKIGDLNMLFKTSGNSMTHFCPPKNHGYSNAFIIDFFAIDCSKIHEKLSSFDFLEAAFKILPDKEYCILLIPTALVPFPLLDLFVRVTPRLMSSFKEELYLCHKNSLLIKTMSVRKTKKCDLSSVNTFLKYVNEGNAVYEDILKNCFEKDKNFESFILTSEETIIGVSLINSQDYVERFHMYFDVADFVQNEFSHAENHSVIKHLILSPIYHNHARFFVRDIMRLVNSSCLYYVYNTTKNHCSLLTALGEFAPVKPKKRVGLNDLLPKVDFPLPEEDKCEDCYGLYFLSPNLCGLHKIHVNVAIVVVGASRTAVSFLEHLIFGPDSYFYNYNNIIWVTPHGLEKEGKDDLTNFMFPIRNSFSTKYIHMLSLETYVSFIFGIMTEINRSKKYIVVNNKATIRYDYLILTCGLQYLSPTPKAKEIFKSRCRNTFRSNLTRYLHPPENRTFYLPKRPSNMFLINTTFDAKHALRTLQLLMQKIKNDEKKIIVYGHDLHVFLTIHALLKLGIPGEFIVFVEPFPSNTTSVTIFNDSSVDEAVLNSVKECRVNYYTNYFLYDWSMSSEDYITTIKFHSKHHQLVIPCLAFFPFLEKLVSEVTYNACNDAGLVYDTKLVINHNFRTNDSFIYAAGPFTKYARRYFASEKCHQYYDSGEVGQKLAEIIRGKINPLLKDETTEESLLVPQLKTPILLYCQMPGDYNLFILRKPGKELDLETAYNFYDYGEVLTTGDCQMTNGIGYFRLHLNPEGFVESITCYTKDKIDYVNLSSLYGLHESLLNNLLLRYDLSLIKNFFEYFREPWTLAISHENFHRLRKSNYNAFFKKNSSNKTFHDRVVEALVLNKWQPLSKTTLKQLESEYVDSVEEDIKNNINEFLDHYKQDLPVYATPNKIKYLLNKNLQL